MTGLRGEVAAGRSAWAPRSWPRGTAAFSALGLIPHLNCLVIIVVQSQLRHSGDGQGFSIPAGLAEMGQKLVSRPRDPDDWAGRLDSRKKSNFISFLFFIKSNFLSLIIKSSIQHLLAIKTVYFFSLIILI